MVDCVKGKCQSRNIMLLPYLCQMVLENGFLNFQSPKLIALVHVALQTSTYTV